MARELHPDSTGGDAAAEAQFKEVTRAYEVLRDPERRARYDRFGPEGVDGPVPGAGDLFGGGLGDLFDAFFGGLRGRRPAPGRARSAVTTPRSSSSSTSERRCSGRRASSPLDTPVGCATCQGTGARAGTTAMRCPECQGAGELHRVRQSILGQVVTAVPCRRCGGNGEVISSPCSDCRGDGRVTEARTFTVDVPAGVDHGSTLRLSGRGPAGPRGGPAGDLYVHLAVRPDDVFVRVGDDVQADLHVSIAQAALGATPEFETLDGTETLAVHPGTQTGPPDPPAGPGRPPCPGPWARRSRRPGRGGHPDPAVQGAGGPPPPVRGRERRGRRPSRRGPHVSPALRLRLIARALRNADDSAHAAGAARDGRSTPAGVGAVAQVFVADLDALAVVARRRAPPRPRYCGCAPARSWWPADGARPVARLSVHRRAGPGGALVRPILEPDGPVVTSARVRARGHRRASCR